MTASVAADSPAPTPRPLREIVAAELRAQKGRRNLTNRKIAKALDVAPAWVDRRMNGTTTCTIEDLEALGRVLDVPVAALFSPPVSGHLPAPHHRSPQVTVARHLRVVHNPDNGRGSARVTPRSAPNRPIDLPTSA